MKLSKKRLTVAVCMSVFSIVSVGTMSSTTNSYASAVEVCNPSAAVIDVAVCMQDINDSIIDSMTLNQQYQLTDARDGQTYYVVKLEDGNVWMSQNLKLFLDNNIALTSETSDLNDNISVAYQDGYTVEDGIIKWFPSSSTIKFDGVTVTGWARSDTAPYSASQNMDTGAGYEMYGNYYNWSSVIASNNSATFSENTFDDTGKTPNNSICPKRWRLPTASSESPEQEGSTNEFARLNQLYNSGRLDTDEGLLAAPVSLVRGGYIRFGLHSRNVSGSYWTGTVNDSETAFYLSVSSNSILPSADDYRSYGRSVRCIARVGYEAESSDSGENDEGAILAPDTGANHETSDFSNSLMPILSVLVSSAVGVFRLISLKKCTKLKSNK